VCEREERIETTAAAGMHTHTVEASVDFSVRVRELTSQSELKQPQQQQQATIMAAARELMRAEQRRERAMIKVWKQHTVFPFQFLFSSSSHFGGQMSVCIIIFNKFELFEELCLLLCHQQ
jgi:hypothetical protein